MDLVQQQNFISIKNANIATTDPVLCQSWEVGGGAVSWEGWGRFGGGSWHRHVMGWQQVTQSHTTINHKRWSHPESEKCAVPWKAIAIFCRQQ